MLLYVVTVKQMKVCNGQRIENGMTADVVTNAINNHVVTNGKPAHCRRIIAPTTRRPLEGRRPQYGLFIC